MGFFDLQVNGYGGVDFNGDNPDPVRVDEVCAELSRQGVDGILVTIITDSLPVMEARLKGLVQLRNRVPSLRQILRGFHIEGPFISPAEGYRGAHPIDAVITADKSVMQRLLDAADGMTRLVTLAPEQDPKMEVIQMLAESNVVVSAGHTNATPEELSTAIDAGVTMFTHFGNGCPAFLPRHDNILNRVLSLRGKIWICFIADGVHIPFFALKSYLDIVGKDRSIVVTDAISAAGLGPGTYRLGRWNLCIDKDGVAQSPDGSHLVGSTITMEASFRNLTQRLGLSDEVALRLLSDNPRKAIREPDRLPGLGVVM